MRPENLFPRRSRVRETDAREDLRRDVCEVRGVLEGRLRIPVPLDDDALGLVVVEVRVVLQRSSVLGPHELHRLSGQALVLVELAFGNPESSDTQGLTHCRPLTVSAPIPRRGTRLDRRHAAGHARLLDCLPDRADRAASLSSTHRRLAATSRRRRASDPFSWTSRGSSRLADPRARASR